MYTEKQVDDMLSQVEQEFEKALGSINKNEETEVAVEAAPEVQEEVIAKSEDAEAESEGNDYETVDELYASMDKGEKEAHYTSIKKSLAAEYEAEEAVEAKSEESMSKSESEVKLETENEELKKSLNTMNGLLDKIFNKQAPQGKAITATSYIAKSEGSESDEEDDKIESMTKSEITSKLKGIDYTDLSKSDRNAINDFCLKNGTKESVKHLI